VRETFEETGVRTRFRSLLSFWHRHGLTWGKSDLYYVARLEPASAAEVEIDR
jgi:ADP-ribose pyrophosphatase YjhB (NUDIX family)